MHTPTNNLKYKTMISFAPQTTKHPRNLTQLAAAADANSRSLEADFLRNAASIKFNAQTGAAGIRNQDSLKTLPSQMSNLVAARNALISLVGDDN
jgi:hypothetical protein